MDLYLTVRFLQQDSQTWNFPLLDYQDYVSSVTDWAHYRRTHQAKDWMEPLGNKWTVQSLDSAIRAWWVDNAAAVPSYRAVHKQKHCVSQTEFHHLFNPPSAELACAYCRIKETELLALVEANQIFTKRLRNRGTSFEVDCRKPELGYSPGNLCLCCYWCNNAKTDEFSDTEFEPVAHALGQIWKQRLTKQ